MPETERTNRHVLNLALSIFEEAPYWFLLEDEHRTDLVRMMLADEAAVERPDGDAVASIVGVIGVAFAIRLDQAMWVHDANIKSAKTAQWLADLRTLLGATILNGWLGLFAFSFRIAGLRGMRRRRSRSRERINETTELRGN